VLRTHTRSSLTRNRHEAVVRAAAVAAMFVVGCAGQSANWLKMGGLTPRRSAIFEKTASNEIRETISILDEPMGIQDAEEPGAEDLAPQLVNQRIGPGDVIKRFPV